MICIYPLLHGMHSHLGLMAADQQQASWHEEAAESHLQASGQLPKCSLHEEVLMILLPIACRQPVMPAQQQLQHADACCPHIASKDLLCVIAPSSLRQAQLWVHSGQPLRRQVGLGSYRAHLMPCLIYSRYSQTSLQMQVVCRSSLQRGCMLSSSCTCKQGDMWLADITKLLVALRADCCRHFLNLASCYLPLMTARWVLKSYKRAFALLVHRVKTTKCLSVAALWMCGAQDLIWPQRAINGQCKPDT